MKNVDNHIKLREQLLNALDIAISILGEKELAMALVNKE